MAEPRLNRSARAITLHVPNLADECGRTLAGDTDLMGA
jgi:hypothetical protein